MVINVEVVPRPTNSQLRKVPLPQNFFDDDFPTCKIGTTHGDHYAKDHFHGKHKYLLSGLIYLNVYTIYNVISR